MLRQIFPVNRDRCDEKKWRKRSQALKQQRRIEWLGSAFRLADLRMR
jgi:hypothetical protein